MRGSHPENIHLRLLLLLALGPAGAAGADSDAEAVAFVDRLDAIGLQRLALREAARLWQSQAVTDDEARLQLAIRLNRLHLSAAAEATDPARQQHHRRRAAELYTEVDRRSRGDGDLDANLDLGLLHFQHGEAAFETWRAGGPASSRPAADNALHRAVAILTAVVDYRDAALARRERELPARTPPEADPLWQDHSEAFNKALYHRGWAYFYRGELQGGDAAKPYAAARDDLAAFAFGDPRHLIVVRALIGYTRSLHRLGRGAEALALLREAEARPMPRAHRLLLLATHCAIIGDAPLPDALVIVLVGQLAELDTEALREDPTAAGLTRRWLRDLVEREAADPDPGRRRVGIRQAERLIAAGGPNLAAGLRTLIALAAQDTSSSRLGPLLTAERAYERGDLEAALRGYATVLEREEVLPPGQLRRMVALKYAALLLDAQQPAAARTVLAELPASLAPVAVGRLLLRLRLRSEEALWLAGAADPSAFVAALQRGVAAEAYHDDELVGTLLRGATLLDQQGHGEAAAAVLAACEDADLAPTDVALLRELIASADRPCDQELADRFIYLLFAGRGSLRPATLAYVGLQLARRCDTAPDAAGLAAAQSRFARLVRDQTEIAADQRRRAGFYLVRADRRRDESVTSLTTLAELVAAPATDAWEAATLLELGDSLLDIDGPQAGRAAELALDGWERAVAWYAGQGHERHANDLRYRLATTLLERGRGAEAQVWFEALPIDQRETVEVLRGRADSLMAQGDLPAALALWRQLGDRLPAGSPAWLAAKLGLARCLLRLGEADQALAVVVYTRELHADLGEHADDFAALEKRCRTLVGGP